MKKASALKINEKVYYGWVIVFVAALGIFFSAPGQTYFISAFTDSYIEAFNLSRTAIASIYSAATILSGALLFLIGKLVDIKGPKFMMIAVGIGLALTALFNSFIVTVPMLAVSFFLSRYMGQGSMAMVPSTLVPQWFRAKRGFAFSLFKFGGTIASVIVPAINIYLISTIGWQMTWRVWSLLLVAIFIPIVFLLVINTPEEIGLSPDNVELSTVELEEEKKEVERESWHLNEALRTPSFWILGLISAITPLITTGLGFHITSILGEKGIDRAGAAIIIGVLSLPGFVFPIIAGTIIDKIGAKKILMMTLFVEALGLVFLNVSSNKAVLIIAVLLYGVGMSTQFVASGVMWPNFFGRKYLGSIQGAAAVFSVVGSAFGTIPFALAYDFTGTYVVIIYVMAAIAIAGGFGAYYIHAPVKQHSN